MSLTQLTLDPPLAGLFVLVLDFNIWALKNRGLRTRLLCVIHPNGANL
jgi:hypothetical protein